MRIDEVKFYNDQFRNITGKAAQEGKVKIDEIPAGRDLDRLIAERVMGWTDLGKPPNECLQPHLWGIPPECETLRIVPFYSTGIAAAWQVMEVLLCIAGEDGGYGTVALVIDTSCKRTLNCWCRYGYYRGSDKIRAGRTSALTVPLVICRIALKAMGYESET